MYGVGVRTGISVGIESIAAFRSAPIEPITTVVANYNYIAPALATLPVLGQIVHGSNVINRLNMSFTDADGKVWDLYLMLPNDQLTINGQVYIITSPPSVYTDYVSVSISPTTQQPPALYAVTLHRP